MQADGIEHSGTVRRQPRVFVSYAYDSPEHVAAVTGLCEQLTGHGVDVVVDRWAGSRRRNWGEWTAQAILDSDYTVVVASAGFKRAAEGTGPAELHRGVQAEAGLLRELLQLDRPLWRTRILPVVLPGRSIAEIPNFLHPHSETHYLVPELTRTGIDDLLRTVLFDTSDTPQPPPVHEGLPADVSMFVGRDRELDRIRTLAGSGGIITIAGKPGVGKSALALRAAHLLRERYPGGQVYLSLAELRAATAADVLHRVVTGLGGRPEGDDLRVLIGMYRTILADRDVLVLVDDVGDRDQVAALATGGSSSLVMVTSRRVLSDLPATYPAIVLDTFGEDDAVALLAAFAGAARTAAEPAAARDVVRQCGQLALAIRIAGGRLAARPSWTIASLADRLSVEHRRLRELKLGDLEVRACIALSYAELDAVDATVFRRLAAIPGPDFADEVAAAASGLDPDRTTKAIDLLADAQLVDSHLPGRYRLHTLIRLFARERLVAEEPSGEQQLAAERLVTAYADAVQSAAHVLHLGWALPRPALSGPSPAPAGADVIVAAERIGTATAWVGAERDNLVAAARLGLHGGRPDALRLTYGVLACLAFAGGLLQDADELATAARDVAVHVGTDDDVVTADYYRATVRRQRADLPVAAVLLEQCRTDVLARGSPHLRGEVLRSLSICYRELRRFDDSARTAAEAITAFTDAGRPEAATGVLSDLAVVLKDSGRVDDAVRLMRVAIARRSALARGNAGDLRSLAWAHENLGAMLKRQGRLEESAAAHRTALTFFRALSQPIGEAYSARNLGELACLRGAHGDGMAWYEHSMRLFRDHGDRRGEHQVLASAALAHAQAGRWPAAIRLLGRWAAGPLPARDRLSTVRLFFARRRERAATGPATQGGPQPVQRFGPPVERLLATLLRDGPPAE